ncbi:hypothetical protein KA119_00925 [Candidatus Gracilibacteria bacterium]|nr:hypothetical protein [Candidatus Gracilibacteria bacterium]
MSSKAPLTADSGVITEGRGGSKGLVLLGTAALITTASLTINRVPAPPCTPDAVQVTCYQKLRENCSLLNPGNGNGIIPADQAQATVLEVAQGVCRSLNHSIPQCGIDYCTGAIMTDNALNQLGL